MFSKEFSLIVLTAASASAFQNSCNIGVKSTCLNSHSNGRREAFKQLGIGFGAMLGAPLVSSAVDDDLTRGGVPLTPFNGLAFQYRGGAENVGLDASQLNEPSIPYSDFLDRLDKGDVEFVEFMAPNGDSAYATFKATVDADGKEVKQPPIRIGQGYPIEDPEGWSSPAFVVKIVKKKNVPYKFTVPMLAKYKQ
mmetsp:Transcript_6011/g.8842  ORF Transcript_6011/g.8842 Transcript_6011/m.8842 type:complete len:194 (+) Transcript_6011:118-699(+)|eukprot:CAMPEP_0194078930 /NCGR_PEP_ID=MMETSP0149-20130528/5223_1 /TAXON_ID=122233 /ORGANISM="Chaetoceros debilis, Strain MM31A-1" /LENGTH=193 /DNA_ID=CAMNT_0038760285 /DNA_START=76 /DNA_END=657 /DNA_ORIENTATION=-